jgi:hypothetical protein
MSFFSLKNYFCKNKMKDKKAKEPEKKPKDKPKTSFQKSIW